MPPNSSLSLPRQVPHHSATRSPKWPVRARRVCSRRRNCSRPQRGNGLRIEVGEIFEDPEGLYTAGAVLPGRLAKLAGPTFEDWLNR